MTVEPTTPTPPRKHHVWILWLTVLCVAAGITALVVMRVHASQNAALRLFAFGKDRGFPVDAAEAARGDLPVYLDGLLGTVTPLNTVTIHTRVSGQLLKVGFGEGQIVHEGDLIAQIDPAPYAAVVKQMQGQLAKDKAMLADAKLDLARYKQAPDAYTSQQIDTQQALVDQDAGNVLSDQGQLDNAQVNLDYCTIKSPVTGLVGLRQVDPGNIVNPTDTNGLVVITVLQPITVVFPIDQDQISQIIGRTASVPPLPVYVEDGDDNVIATGKLVAIDSQVNAGTGTINCKALFDNKHIELFPTQLLKNTRMLVNTLHDVLLVPSEAIQTGPDSTFVYVVKSDNTVDVRKIKVSRNEDDLDLAEIQDGLSPGELVVTNGVDKLEQGSKVEVIHHSTPTTRQSATTRPGATRPSRTPRTLAAPGDSAQ